MYLMRLYENICSPELLRNSALCRRNASSQENNIQQDHSVSSSLSSLQRKPISVFLTLRDCCPEQGESMCIYWVPESGPPRGSILRFNQEKRWCFLPLIQRKPAHMSRQTYTQHRIKTWKSLPWDVTDVVALFFPWKKLSSPFSALCPNFLSCMLSFSFPRAGTALLAPTQ